MKRPAARTETVSQRAAKAYNFATPCVPPRGSACPYFVLAAAYFSIEIHQVYLCCTA